ncbi:MAG: Endonuclease/Exonuclease/phosphatase family [Verrucomicrobiota bacterium]|jgi:endonuclease/exonuclease/phosphatase family metal-dependent hydrolase
MHHAFMKMPALLRCLATIIASTFLVGCEKKATAPVSDSPARPESVKSEPPALVQKAAEPRPQTAPATAAGKKIRIVTWNLQWFPGHKPETTAEIAAKHMADAQKAVAELKPDILMLQEVRNWKSAADLCSVIPGLRPHVVSAFDESIPDARPQNQVVAANLESDSAWSAKWVGGNYGPPRGYAFAALDAGGGRFILCWSLHLKSNRGELDENISMRAESTRQLIAHMQEMLAIYGKRGPCAIVVAGDMNTSSDDPKFAGDPTLQGFKDAGLWWTHSGVPFASRTTIPGEGNYPDNCFDHIFTAGLGQPVATVKAFPGISDHNPVIVDIDLSKADFRPAIDVAAGLKPLAKIAAPSVPVDLPGIIKASDDAAIRAAIGKNVTIQGRVSNVGATATGSMNFINFEGSARGNFVCIVKKDHLTSVAEPHGGTLQTLVGKNIEVRGELILYKTTPEIELRSPAGLRVLP